MSESTNRIIVSRSRTRKRGDEYEKVILSADVAVPSGMTYAEAFADLDNTVKLALQDATQQANKSQETTKSQPTSQAPVLPAEHPSTPSTPSWEPTTHEEPTRIQTQDGKTTLASAYTDKTSLRVVVSPSLTLDAKGAPISSFLQPRVLEAMIAADKEHKVPHQLAYEIKTTQDGQRLIEIHVRNVEDERRHKELIGAITWTLRRLADKK